MPRRLGDGMQKNLSSAAPVQDGRETRSPGSAGNQRRSSAGRRKNFRGSRPRPAAKTQTGTAGAQASRGKNGNHVQQNPSDAKREGRVSRRSHGVEATPQTSEVPAARQAQQRHPDSKTAPRNIRQPAQRPQPQKRQQTAKAAAAPQQEDPGLLLISRRPPKQKFANFEEYIAAHGGVTSPVGDAPDT